MNSECLFCQVNSFQKLLKKYNIKEEDKDDLVKNFFSHLGQIKYNQTAPEIARDIHKKIQDLVSNFDPYREDKIEQNNDILSNWEPYKELIDYSFNPFETALRLAIAGNIIDNGPNHKINLQETIDSALRDDFSINHSLELKHSIENAKTILYLGDNAGEIVFDKLFIETMQHPNVYYAVKSAPIINDVTIEDANMVDMHSVAKVIENGSDAPSTLLNEVSPEFMDIYNSADVIISKGQGNLEGLVNTNNEKIFFLLIVKCKVIGELLDVEQNGIVVKKHMLAKDKSLALHVE